MAHSSAPQDSDKTSNRRSNGSRATSRKAGKKSTTGAAAAGLVGVTALLPARQTITAEINEIIATGQRLIWPLVMVTILFLLIAGRELRKQRVVARAQKPIRAGEVLCGVIEASGGSRLARADVVSALGDIHGRARPVRRRMVSHQEGLPSDDVEWWRRIWRWVWDLDDSTIENLADDVLALALTKEWVKRKDGSTTAGNFGFDDYYSTKRRCPPRPGDAGSALAVASPAARPARSQAK